jgi:hypothetical protein
VVEKPDNVLVDASDVGTSKEYHTLAFEEFPHILTQKQV